MSIFPLDKLNNAVALIGANYDAGVALEFLCGVADGDGAVRHLEHLEIVALVPEHDNLAPSQSTALGQCPNGLVFCRPAVVDSQPEPAGRI